MKILELNTVPYGSTGKIAAGVAEVARQNGHDVIFVLGWTKKKKYKAESNEWIVVPLWEKVVHEAAARITGLDGFLSAIATRKFIRRIKRYQPDIVHLHMVHSCFLNLPMLFDYLRTTDAKVIWTFHDCWAFTGGCPHFELAGCNRWKSGCHDCPQKIFPIDCSSYIWKKKKKAFYGVKSMVVTTPSRWLAGLVKESMFGQYPIQVIHNGINMDIFKPTESNLRIQWKCENKTILLGVAFGWGYKKGLDIFIELAEMLDEQYQIVLVGTDDKVDKKLHGNIISVHRTVDQIELAKIYSASDLFLNPTREEVFGMVNVEALACGTPVITFNTGGSPEAINESCGIVTAERTAESMKLAIEQAIREPFTESACLKRAGQFKMEDCFRTFVDLYED